MPNLTKLVVLRHDFIQYKRGFGALIVKEYAHHT